MITKGTRVYVDTPVGAYMGTVTDSGSQAQVWMYGVELDDPTNYPDLPEGVRIVVVPADKVRLQTVPEEVPPMTTFLPIADAIQAGTIKL